MKTIYSLFFLLVVNQTFSQSVISGFIVVPEEKKHELEYQFQTKKSNTTKQFIYTTVVEDPNGILQYFNLNTTRLNAGLRIPGQQYTSNIEEADIVYKYIFTSANVTDEEVYANGRNMMTGTVSRPYYQAKGIYNIDVCLKVLYPKTNKSTSCGSIEKLSRMSIEAEEDLNPNVAAANWNSSRMKDKVGSEIRRLFKDDFSFQTGGQGIGNNYKAKLFLAMFNVKGTKKHLKKESDVHAKNLGKLLKLYTADFGDYFAFKCVSANPSKDLTTCFKEYRNNMQKKKDLIPESITFWKNELESKYKLKGKKVEIRNTMALNLFSASILNRDLENVKYALNILQEERYGNKRPQHKGRHYDLKHLYNQLKDKTYEFLPSYYSFGTTSETGADFPLN